MKQMSTVQPFRITDALRCTLLNAPRGANLAFPSPAFNHGGLHGGLVRCHTNLWRNAVLQPQGRLALARWQGTRLTSLATARTRAGHRAWEVEDLYLSHLNLLPLNGAGARGSNGQWAAHAHANNASSDADADDGMAESLALMEELFRHVGERAGERVFLRLDEGSCAAFMAQRSGFTAVCGQTLLYVPAPAVNGARAGWAALAEVPADLLRDGRELFQLRTKLPSDDYGLFQLYSAAVPAPVRQALGITFDQWRDVREPTSRRLAPAQSVEWVVEREGRIIGWAKLTGGNRPTGAEVMAHPDSPDVLFRLVDFASSRSGPGLRWLVSDYQAPVAERLGRQGARPVAEYKLLVKIVAVPALSYGMAPAEA